MILSILSIVLIFVLSSMIFDVDVITNDSKMKMLLINELNNNGISKYKFRKSYKTIEKIKKNIKEKYKDNIEWIEIENIGTKYVVRYEPRIINKTKDTNKPRNIIAKKDSIITKITASSGEIIKGVNTYVKKGDIIVSGYIYLNEDIKDIKSSDGIVFGEVWYKVSIKYPYNYKEIIKTGNINNTISINFLNKKLVFSKYKNKSITDNIIIKDNLLPINISFSKEEEIKIIKESKNVDEIVEKALNKSRDKIDSLLKKSEYIKEFKILNKYINNDYVELEIFYTVVEDITDYSYIDNNANSY